MSDADKWTLLMALIVVAFGTALLIDLAKGPAPKPVQVNAVPELNGCPFVGHGHTAAGSVVACYACDGETPVCLVIGGEW